jgi:hypothetical protein
VIDFLANEAHLVDHLAPIWRQLDEHERGRFYVCARHITPAAAQHPDLTFTAQPFRQPLRVDGGRPVAVATAGDEVKVPDGRPIVFVEHGAGQRYGPRPDRSYSGGPHRERVNLFVCPNDDVYEANLARYTEAVGVVVGCPKLDQWHQLLPCFCEGNTPTTPVTGAWEVASLCDWHGDPAEEAGRRGAGQPRPTVAISFHWEVRLYRESGSAFGYYRPHVPAAVRDLRAAGVTVLGHAHPRAARKLAPWWKSLGVEFVPTFAEVVERADLYAVDNSSTLYEFASLGRPVVVLNAPHYRRDVEHGLRFWSCADVGRQVDDARQLAPAIFAALADDRDPYSPQAARRREIVGQVYKHTDGTAANRAADAIRRTVL